ncbi:MAG: pyridoxal phosphate-dependent aminotransferase [Muricoprocola sp.]
MNQLNQRMVSLGTQRSVIRELFEFGKLKAAEIGAENVFDFSIGNPSVPSPVEVNETAIKLIQETDPVILHGYTSAQGDADARKLLADSVNRRFHTAFGPDNFYLTVGAAAALCCCLNGLCNPSDEVIVFAPYFPEYKVFIEGAGANMTLIPADTDTFQIDFEKLEASVTEHTKAIIVNSPNNPCGVVYSEETVKKLAKVLTEKSNEYGHPIYLIADEPYREIVFDHTVVPYLPNYYNNTLVCYSWSKSLSLPGERLGYVLVPDEVEDHELVYAAVAGAGRSLGYVNAPGLFQRVCALCADLTADITIYETNRNLLYNGLKELGFDVVKPDGTFYIFPRTLEEDDIAFCQRAKAYNLLIVPGTGFGCPGHTRISYCVPTERIERALTAFKKLADSYKNN